MSCEDLPFTETVRCEIEGNYEIAWGWTQSTGQSAGFPYTPPAPWEYDTRYADERGVGHGGCTSCVMTLIHLRKPYTVQTPPIAGSDITLLIVILLIVAGFYVLFGRD